MNVNIFGVGRSGTKIVQLYTCLAAIQTEGSCILSYEPFLWRSRRCLQSYAPGVRAHRMLPMLVEDPNDAMAEARSNGFLAGLHRLGQDRPVVAKYIRANGRIPLMEDRNGPVKTVFVMRDLSEVLKSIHKQPWDLLGDGLEGLGLANDWERLKREAESLGSRYPYRDWLKHLDETDPLDRNAFYWAVMNHFALTKLREGNDKYLISFNDLKADANAALQPISDYLGWSTVEEDFRSISGDRIHVQSMITACRWKYVSSSLDLIRMHPRTWQLFKKANRKVRAWKGGLSASVDLPIETVCRSPLSLSRRKRHSSKSGAIQGLGKPIYEDLNREVVELFHDVKQ